MQLIFEAIAIRNNVGYAADYNENGLFRVDMNTGECEFLCEFAQESMMEKRMFSKAVWVGDLIYFIPAAAEALHIFDTKSETMKSVNIPKANKGKFPFYKAKTKFIDAIINDDFLWLIPSSYPGILRINLKDNSVKVFDNWIPEQGYFFRAKAYVEDERFIIPDGQSNQVLIFDMEKGTAELPKVGKNNNGVMKFVKKGDVFFFAPRIKGSIICWNPETKEIKEYGDYPEGFSGEQIVFSNCYAVDDQIVFAPSTANKGIILKNDRLYFDENTIWKTKEKNKVEYLFQDDISYYYREQIPDEDDRTYKINKLDVSYEETSFYVKDPNKYKRNIINGAAGRMEHINENKILSLKDFLESIGGK